MFRTLGRVKDIIGGALGSVAGFFGGSDSVFNSMGQVATNPVDKYAGNTMRHVGRSSNEFNRSDNTVKVNINAQIPEGTPAYQKQFIDSNMEQAGKKLMEQQTRMLGAG